MGPGDKGGTLPACTVEPGQARAGGQRQEEQTQRTNRQRQRGREEQNNSPARPDRTRDGTTLTRADRAKGNREGEGQELGNAGGGATKGGGATPNTREQKTGSNAGRGMGRPSQARAQPELEGHVPLEGTADDRPRVRAPRRVVPGQGVRVEHLVHEGPGLLTDPPRPPGRTAPPPPHTCAACPGTP